MAGMLEMAVLGLLKGQDMHGYELKKRLSDVFGVSSAVSFGSLYPALARLEAAGAVRALGDVPGQVTGGPARAAGHGADRRRKVYGITGSGHQNVRGPPARYRSWGRGRALLPFAARFCPLPPSAEPAGPARTAARCTGGAPRPPGEPGPGTAGRPLHARPCPSVSTRLLSGDVSWLDHLIEEERASAAATRRRAPRRRGLGRPPSHPQARLVPLASASQLQRPAAIAPGAQALAPR